MVATSVALRTAIWIESRGSESQCLQQCIRLTGFRYERVGTRGQSIVAAIKRETVDHDAHTRPTPLDLGRRGDPVESRHTHVQDDQVGRELLNPIDRLLTVCGLADDLEAGVRREQCAYCATRALPIVCDQQAGWPCGHGTFSVPHVLPPGIERMHGFGRCDDSTFV